MKFSSTKGHDVPREEAVILKSSEFFSFSTKTFPVSWSPHYNQGKWDHAHPEVYDLLAAGWSAPLLRLMGQVGAE